MRRNAAEALVFQDEMEIHRHPTLARMLAPVGPMNTIPALAQASAKSGFSLKNP